jgi:hypothetical protein
MAFDSKKFKEMTLDQKIAYIGFKDEEDLKTFIIKTLTDTFIANPKYCKARTLATLVRDSIKTIPGWYYVRLSAAILFARNFYREEYNEFLNVVQLFVLQKRGELQYICTANSDADTKKSQITDIFTNVINFIFALRDNKEFYYMTAATVEDTMKAFMANPNENEKSRINTRKRRSSTVSNNSPLNTVAPIAVATVAETGPLGAGVGPLLPPSSGAVTRSRSTSQSSSGSKSASKSSSKSSSGSKSSTGSPVSAASPTRSPSRSNSNSMSHKKRRVSKKPSRVYKWSPNRNVPSLELEDIINTPAQIKAKAAKAAKEAAKKAAKKANVAAQQEKNARLVNAFVAAKQGIEFAKTRRNAASRLRKSNAAARAAEEVLQKNAATKNNSNVFRRAHEPPTVNVRLTANPEKPPTF